MNISRRHFLILLPAAAVAWKSVLAGTPEPRPNYKMSEHWWGMLIDIPQVHRLRQLRARLPDGKRCARRIFPHVGGALPRRRRGHDQSRGRSRPTAARKGSRWRAEDAGKYFFVPKMCNHCADSPCTQVCPVGATFVTPGRRGAGGSEILPWMRLLRAGLPLRLPLHPSGKNVADKCTLCYHRITKGLTTACCEACPTGARQLADLKNPKDPIHEFLKTHPVQVLKPQMATGAKVYYNGLDGSVR